MKKQILSLIIIAATLAVVGGTAPQSAAQGQPPGVPDIKMLAKNGVSDEVILSQIRNSHTVYHLSAAEIIDLKDAGVSQKVIDFMINTPSTNPGGPAVVATPPVAAPAPAVTAAPPPPPPPVVAEVGSEPPPPMVETVVVSPGPQYIWVAGRWRWYGRRWIWARGEWIIPPHHGAVWVEGRWGRRFGGVAWIDGHWR